MPTARRCVTHVPTRSYYGCGQPYVSSVLPAPSTSSMGWDMQVGNATKPVIFVLYHKTGHSLANTLIRNLWSRNLVQLPACPQG